MSHDPFAEFDEVALAPQTTTNEPKTASDDGNFSEEIVSHRLEARNRTFYIDLKKSVHGKFLKISEKSRGRKSTIIMDVEDVTEFMSILEDVRSSL
ncbi:MAG: hypothetical protein N4A36_01500 [Candidatus Gracilibacteria bacterium]|jgi:hypothetical protein|nr:hypothetical protein [Candidatus Gracilibacteria bacterium]